MLGETGSGKRSIKLELKWNLSSKLWKPCRNIIKKNLWIPIWYVNTSIDTIGKHDDYLIGARKYMSKPSATGLSLRVVNILIPMVIYAQLGWLFQSWCSIQKLDQTMWFKWSLSCAALPPIKGIGSIVSFLYHHRKSIWNK